VRFLQFPQCFSHSARQKTARSCSKLENIRPKKTKAAPNHDNRLNGEHQQAMNMTNAGQFQSQFLVVVFTI